MSVWAVAAGLLFTLVFVTIVHETGHAIAAWLMGIPIKRIALGVGPTLWRRQVGETLEIVVRAAPAGVAVGVPMRRTADGRSSRPVTHDLVMAASGPAASLALALVLLPLITLAQPSSGMAFWLVSIALLSAVLGLLNLIPIPGLDGGHLLILTLALLGWEASPPKEMALHRTGLRMTTAACLVLLVIAMTSFAM